MPSPLVTRFPGGLNDASPGGALESFAGLRPARYAQDFDEMFSYFAADWILTETAAGSTETVATTGDGGWYQITNVSAGAADEASIQWCGGNAAVARPWTFDSTKDFFMGARFKVSDATNTALVIGLAIPDTTPVASLPADGIFFSKVAASTSLLAHSRVGGVSTSVTLGVMANDTFVDVYFNYNSDLQRWYGFFNNVLIGSFALGTTTTAVTLAKTIGLLNASAVAHVLSIDYLHVAKQR